MRGGASNNLGEEEQEPVVGRDGHGGWAKEEERSLKDRTTSEKIATAWENAIDTFSNVGIHLRETGKDGTTRHVTTTLGTIAAMRNSSKRYKQLARFHYNAEEWSEKYPTIHYVFQSMFKLKTRHLEKLGGPPIGKKFRRMDLHPVRETESTFRLDSD